MDHRLLIILISIIFTVKCQTSNDNKTVIDGSIVKVIVSEGESITTQESQPSEPPDLCTVCSCIGNIVDCANKNLTNHFEDSQWPSEELSVVTFKNNSLIHVKPFTAARIRKLILRANKITKIDQAAFKRLINLTELDLSHNQLTMKNLQPNVFEGKFSPSSYEPLESLEVLNLAHNVFYSLHQDLFEHLSDLKLLNLSGNNFSNVDHSTMVALSSLTDLEELDMSYCGVKAFPSTFFTSMRNLTKLDLSGNQFGVPPSTLQGAKALKILYMNENPIQIIDSTRSFPRLPNLKELSLCCMPYLSVVGAYAFANLTSLEHLRIANCPKLESIDEYALASQIDTEGPVWPPLKKLYLSDNALRYLPKQFVARWDWLEELDLMNNKWSCDCYNQYLIGMLLPDHGQKLMGEDMFKLTCAMPPEHSGKNLTSFSHSMLRCPDLYGAQPEKDTAILIGVLIGVLLAIPVCLAIFFLWRRGYFFCGTPGPASFSRAFYTRTTNDEDF